MDEVNLIVFVLLGGIAKPWLDTEVEEFWTQIYERKDCFTLVRFLQVLVRRPAREYVSSQ
jgi:hypothetical protein